MLRQEKRAEAQAKLQTAANVSQIVPLNMKAFVEDFLESYGVQDTEKYFAQRAWDGRGSGGLPGSPAVPRRLPLPSRRTSPQVPPSQATPRE